MRSAVLFGLLPLSVAGVFGTILLLLDLPRAVQVAAVFAILISLVIASAIVVEVWRMRRSRNIWRVEITHEALSWTAPTQKLMSPIRLSLNTIKQTRHVRHIAPRNQVNDFESSAFFVDLTDGSNIEIEYRITGIDPIKVFEALETKGIPFIRDAVEG